MNSTDLLPILTTNEIDGFLKQYPRVQEVSLLCADLLGLPRGKQVSIKKLVDLTKCRLTLPKSIMLENSLGRNFSIPSIPSTDPDYPVFGIAGTLHPSLWSVPEMLFTSGDQKKISDEITRCHILVGLLDDNNQPFVYGGRDLVRKMANLIKDEFGLTVSLAIELEFYLYQSTKNSRKPLSHLSSLEGSDVVTSQCYGIDYLENLAPLFDRLKMGLEIQNLEIEGISSEYGEGQFEVNLKYRPDPVAACDDAFLFKHSLKSLVKPWGVSATFMALSDRISANGMHINLSLQDEKGNPVFKEIQNGDQGNALSQPLRNAIGGLQQTVKDAMLIYAPNPNSYKRYYSQSYTPMHLSNWGRNNRTVSIRVPELGKYHRTNDDWKSMRLEQRVPGADANPYLATAAVLGGVYYGLKHQLEPSKMEEGDAYEVPIWEEIPPSMSESLRYWKRPENIFRPFFGEDFFDTFFQHRTMEWYEYQGTISSVDFDWYFHY